MTTKNHYTAESATQFDSVSMASAMQVAMQLKCECQPYLDTFTYNRWIAQGYQVKKGERGIHLSTFVHKEYVDKDGNTKHSTFPKGVTVFCRCQVEKITK